MKGRADMQKQEIIDHLTGCIAEMLMADAGEIAPDASLTEELGVDSLDLQALYVTISSKYGISYNLIKIVNDAAGILSGEQQEISDEEKLSRIEETMKITLSDEDKTDFLARMKTEPAGLLLKRLQGYISVELLADSIEKLTGGA